MRTRSRVRPRRRRVQSKWLLGVLLAASALAADMRMAAPEYATTGQRISALEKSLVQNPRSVAFQNQLAAAYLQKVRETVDFGYLDRAERIVNQVLARDDGNYEALRMREVAEMERHHFQAAADLAETLIGL